jgi:ribosome-associated heat shock protein Hsp15
MTAGAGPKPPATTQRLDKWLWFARLAKSRTLAAAGVDEGKIKVNRVRAEKPSQLVKLGDVITSRLKRDVRVLRVTGLGTRRGPAAEAQALYEDLTPRAPPPGSSAEAVGGTPAGAWASREPGSGRPTKRERRLLDELKGRS